MEGIFCALPRAAEPRRLLERWGCGGFVAFTTADVVALFPIVCVNHSTGHLVGIFGDFKEDIAEVFVGNDPLELIDTLGNDLREFF